MPRRRSPVTLMSTQIREDKIKITLIPTHDNSLKMTLLQHVINKNTLSHVSLRSQAGMMAEGIGHWLFPGFLAYVITGWLNRGNIVSTCLVLVHPENTFAELLLSLIYRWGWSWQGKGLWQSSQGKSQNSQTRLSQKPAQRDCPRPAEA